MPFYKTELFLTVGIIRNTCQKMSKLHIDFYQGLVELHVVSHRSLSELHVWIIIYVYGYTRYIKKIILFVYVETLFSLSNLM